MERGECNTRARTFTMSQDAARARAKVIDFLAVPVIKMTIGTENAMNAKCVELVGSKKKSSSCVVVAPTIGFSSNYFHAFRLIVPFYANSIDGHRSNHVQTINLLGPNEPRRSAIHLLRPSTATEPKRPQKSQTMMKKKGRKNNKWTKQTKTTLRCARAHFKTA